MIGQKLVFNVQHLENVKKKEEINVQARLLCVRVSMCVHVCVCPLSDFLPLLDKRRPCSLNREVSAPKHNTTSAAPTLPPPTFLVVPPVDL